MIAICNIEDCSKAVFRRSWCSTHYSRWLRHGEPRYKITGTLLQSMKRFWLNTDFNSLYECWHWNGRTDKNGYGRLNFRSKDFNKNDMAAHRLSYMLFAGELNPKLVINHICHNTLCVNPLHLEQITLSENSKDRWHDNSWKTHCKHGHIFDKKNTRTAKRLDRITRVCRKCSSLNSNKYRNKVRISI